MIRWHDIAPAGEALHVAYVEKSEAGSWQPHGHNFYEVFWVDSGRGCHLVGPEAAPSALLAGQFVFIRSGDVHGFTSEASTEPFALINVAFSCKAWAELRDRYQLDWHPVFSETANRPPTQELEGEMRRDISQSFRALLQEPRSELVRDSFLLSLARKLGEASPMPGLGSAPAWLRRGLLHFLADPEALRSGVPRLARLAGCSMGHLARTMRATLGIAPSAWLMEVRLRRAARLLESTSFSVSDIAWEAGFENLSHFHRCFRSHLKQTPLRYRKQRARLVM